MSWYWVEPDPGGTWRVHVQYETKQGFIGQPPKTFSGTSDAYSLVRVRTSDRGTPLPAAEQSPGQSYRLKLLGKDGEEVVGGL